MARINPFMLPRPARQVFTETFSVGTSSVTFAFRVPDAADMNRAAEKSENLVKDFITGHPEDGTPAADFFDGIKVSASLFQLCASAEEMQPPKDQMPEGAQWSDATEFVIWLDRLEHEGPRLARFINDTIRGWRRAPNSPGAPTEQPSEERSNSRLDIPNLNSATTPSWTPSTEGSEASAVEMAERIPAGT